MDNKKETTSGDACKVIYISYICQAITVKEVNQKQKKLERANVIIYVEESLSRALHLEPLQEEYKIKKIRRRRKAK